MLNKMDLYDRVLILALVVGLKYFLDDYVEIAEQLAADEQGWGINS